MKKLVFVGLICVLQCWTLAQADGREIGSDKWQTGTNPTNISSPFLVQCISLNPTSFIVTLSFSTIANHQFGILAHDGEPTTNYTPWTVVGSALTDGTTLIFKDNISGSLLHSGKTYLGFLEGGAVNPGTVVTSLENWVISGNQAYVAYPFLTNPVVRILDDAPQDTVIAVEYGEGIYSNTVRAPIANDGRVAFFRLFSTNNDPVNACIQIQTNLAESNWSNVSEP